MRIGGVNNMKKYKIAVAGTGYVGLSIATLLSQHHHETAVDIIPEKVEMINNRKSPIQDDYIEKYLAEKELNLTVRIKNILNLTGLQDHAINRGINKENTFKGKIDWSKVDVRLNLEKEKSYKFLRSVVDLIEK